MAIAPRIAGAALAIFALLAAVPTSAAESNIYVRNGDPADCVSLGAEAHMPLGPTSFHLVQPPTSICTPEFALLGQLVAFDARLQDACGRADAAVGSVPVGFHAGC